MTRFESLLRRMLSWPIVWAWVAAYVLRNFEHSPFSDCIVCEAHKRRQRSVHEQYTCVNSVVICRKCSLPFDAWKEKPRCSNKRPNVLPLPEKKAPYLIIPTDW